VKQEIIKDAAVMVELWSTCKTCTYF